jgi:hypothetical protein
MTKLLLFEAFITNIVRGHYTDPKDVTEEMKELYQKWVSVGSDDSQKEQVMKELNSFFQKHRGDYVRLYHGTHNEHPIMDKGILTTKRRTKRSLQSQTGYVYLSYFPTMAKTFGEMAYPGEKVTVYEVKVPITYLKPDTDQLRNRRYWGENMEIGDTLADSLVHGNGFRVKGDIPPYMTKVHI